MQMRWKKINNGLRSMKKERFRQGQQDHSLITSQHGLLIKYRRAYNRPDAPFNTKDIIRARQTRYLLSQSRHSTGSTQAINRLINSRLLPTAVTSKESKNGERGWKIARPLHTGWSGKGGGDTGARMPKGWKN